MFNNNNINVKLIKIKTRDTYIYISQSLSK